MNSILRIAIFTLAVCFSFQSCTKRKKQGVEIEENYVAKHYSKQEVDIE